MEKPGESDWSARKTDESVDATKDSWESNASKNGDKRKDGSNNKRSGSTSSPQEQSGWGAEPKTKDTGGWGTSSSNYEEVENWGITQPENGGKAPSNDNENKNNQGTDSIDNNKETGNTENSATNEITDSRDDTRDTSWDENPTEVKVNDDNWGTPNQEPSKSWNDEVYDDKATSDWGNQQDNSNDYQRREDDRPRSRGGRRGSRGGRGERGGRAGRGGRGGPPRDNFRRDQENDYRGHSHRPSNTRNGRNQINDRHDSYNENERKEKERDSKSVNKKHGGLYDSIHAPKPEADTAADSAPKTDTVHPTPYVNEDRVLSGGARPQKKSDEEIDEIMERMKKQNEEIEEKRKIVEEDELNFQKDEEARKKKELENRESQRRKREEEEEDRRRREHQAIQLQKEIDEAREINATNKSKSRDNREWDTGKKDYDWNNTRNQRNNSRGGGNSYRNGSRDENPYRNGSPSDNRDYDRRGPHGNEYGERRGGRGRGDRRGDRGENRGRRRNGRSGGGRGGGGRRYSDQHKDPSNKSEEAFGSGNSWAEQTEQQEKDNNNWSNEMEWDNRNNNAPDTESADTWGSVDKNAEQNTW